MNLAVQDLKKAFHERFNADDDSYRHKNGIEKIGIARRILILRKLSLANLEKQGFVLKPASEIKKAFNLLENISRETEKGAMVSLADYVHVARFNAGIDSDDIKESKINDIGWAIDSLRQTAFLGDSAINRLFFDYPKGKPAKNDYSEQEKLDNLLDVMGVLKDSVNSDKTIQKAISDFGMTKAEATAVVFYSTIGYKILNSHPNSKFGELYAQDKDKLDSSRKVLTAALKKMPVFQGQVIRYSDLSEKSLKAYQFGKIIKPKTFMSSSSDLNYVHDEGFDGESTKNTVFYIESKTGRSIQSVSKFENESEVLFDRAAAFKVIEKTKQFDDRQDTDVYIIKLEEVLEDD
jgi:hypothetical protein